MARALKSSAAATREIDTLAGVALGARLPEQWGVPKELRGPVDFYDVKGDRRSAASPRQARARRSPSSSAALAALHPGRAARVLRRGRAGRLARELHPTLVRALDFTYAPVLFELGFMTALAVRPPTYQEISRFPQVRRDLAVVVDESRHFK